MICVGCSKDIEFKTSVSIDGDKWYINEKIINSGTLTEGLLMNVRMVNSVFDDSGQELSKLTDGFDPEANTTSFIEKIPEYTSNGVNAFTVSLQGGMPGFEGAVNTAFNSDGSLKIDYLNRVERIIRSCDANNAAIILSLFYQRQHSHDSALSDKESILKALENVVDWIHQKKFTNVVLEVSNEYRHGGFKNWPAGDWLMSETGQIELMSLAKKLNPELLVSTSGMGNGMYHEDLANTADFLLIHFNTTSLDLYESRISDLKKFGKPIVSNEDDKLGVEGAAALALAVKNGSSWGYMGLLRNQYYPFEFLGIDDDPEVYRMFRNLSTPGYKIDPATFEHHSITINYPHDGEIFHTEQNVEINLSHLYADTSEASSIVVMANKEQIAEIKNGIRLRVSWKPNEAGIYDFQAIVLNEQENEMYRSAKVDIIVQSKQ